MTVKLRAELVRTDGVAALYVNQANTATLKLFNQTGADIAIAPGTPSPVPARGGPLEVHLYFTSLFADGDAGGVSLSAPGWEPKYFGQEQFRPWALAATAPIAWPRDGVLSFAVDNLRPGTGTGPKDVQVEVYNLPGAYAALSTIVVPVENPPVPGDLNLRTRARMTLDSSTVAISRRADEPAYTDLRLRLSNDDPQRDLVPGDVPWGARDPEFALSFVLVSEPPGYYALTTPSKAAEFEVGFLGESGWEVKRDPGATVWRLRPQRHVNHAILGTGLNAIAEFSIRRVQTEFAAGPTLVYVQYTDVPGYDDGYFTAVLEKVYGEMRITSFTASRQRVPASLEAGTAYLNWDVENATLVELSGHGQVKPHTRAFPVSINRDERLVLTAYDGTLKKIASQFVTLQVDPPISMRWVPCGGIVLWRGSESDIPHGFVLCNGENGTPDLRDQFVEGAGGADQPRASGDPSHTHTLGRFNVSTRTSSAGEHEHLPPGRWYNRGFGNAWYSPNRTAVDTNGWFYGLPLRTAGGHDHAVNADFGTLTTGAIEGRVRPKWYAACYLMKLHV